ncbi:MAG: pyridoxal phosphate-dependent aminotransferase [Bacteriovoracaceae bacterium]
MKTISRVVDSFKESIFATMTEEALAHKAVNLGQGFPDFSGPEWLIELLKNSYRADYPLEQQYAPFSGSTHLRKSVSSVYRRQYHLDFDPDHEVTILNGATEAIFCTCLALLNPGDEVIVIEPFYDSYVSSIELAHAKAVAVTLHLPDRKIDWDELRSAINAKTKMIILNNPHNPTGKVYTHEELQKISEFVQEFDLYLLSDEVYEYLTFDGMRHIPTATFTNIKERVITISSVGKTFGMTGLKIGWTLANANITKAIRLVHQYNTFSVHHPTQIAMAEALDQIESYLPDFRKSYGLKRDILKKGLEQAGFLPLITEGTYFMLAPIPSKEKDTDYVMDLIRTKGVAAIPPSVFYLKSTEGQKFIRFCFAKSEKTLSEAIHRLSN